MATIFGQIDSTDNLRVNLFRKGPKKIYVNDTLLKKQSELQNYITVSYTHLTLPTICSV